MKVSMGSGRSGSDLMTGHIPSISFLSTLFAWSGFHDRKHLPSSLTVKTSVSSEWTDSYPLTGRNPLLYSFYPLDLLGQKIASEDVSRLFFLFCLLSSHDFPSKTSFFFANREDVCGFELECLTLLSPHGQRRSTLFFLINTEGIQNLTRLAT